MKVYRDKMGNEVSFPGEGTAAHGMVDLTEAGNRDSVSFPIDQLGHCVADGTAVRFDVHDSKGGLQDAYEMVFDTAREAEDLVAAFYQFDTTETIDLEIPRCSSDLQRLTWTIAAALIEYDPSIDTSGDSASILGFVEEMGVDLPM